MSLLWYCSWLPINTYRVISYNTITMTFVTTSNCNKVDYIFVKKHVNVWDTRMSTVTLQTNIVLAWRWLVWVETCKYNEVEEWYVRHNYFIVLLHRQYVSTCIQVIFRPSFTDKSIKCYTCWDPIMLTEVKYIKT